MEFESEKSDQFPPIFNQFRDFFVEQREVLLENFEMQRKEMFEEFTKVVIEKEEMKKELDKTKKDLKESKDTVEEIEKMENEEIEELEMKLRIINESLRKNEGSEKELVRAKSKSEELQIKQNIANGIIDKLKNDIKELKCFKEENNMIKLELERLKKEKEVSNDEFKGALQNLNDQKDNLKSKGKEDIAVLEKEIKDLAETNQEKGKLVKKLSEETEEINEKIKILEIENGRLKTRATSVPETPYDEPNLFEELLQKTENTNQFTLLECEECEKTFKNKHSLRYHKRKCTESKYFNQKVNEIKKKVAKQRSILTEQIFQIKETEIHAKYSCNSRCKGTCRIFHQKHNWERLASEHFLQTLKEIRIKENYKCENCERSFDEMVELEKYIEIIHCVEICDSTRGITGDLKRSNDGSNSILEESGRRNM